MANSRTISISVANALITGQNEFDDNVDRFTSITANLDVTAVTGDTPTMDLDIEWSMDGVNWISIITFTQATGITQEYKNVATPFGSRLRANYALTGTTPDYTFTLTLLLKD